MTNAELSPGVPSSLTYKDQPIRFWTFDGKPVPWFAVEDILSAMGLAPYLVERVLKPEFPSHARMVCEMPTPTGLSEITAVSPSGVWWISALADPRRGRYVAAWAKRESLALYPDASPDDGTMFLTLGDQNALPPRPDRYSGRLSEWLDLREARIFRTIEGNIRDRRERQEAFIQAAQDAHERTAA